MSVSAMHRQDAATLDDAMIWVKAMAQKGKWTESAARVRLAALSAAASILGPEDDRTARGVLERADVILGDWARKTTANPTTTRTYTASARATLRIYLAYLEDPAKAQFAAAATTTRPRKSKAPVAECAAPELPLAAPPTPTAAPPAGEAAVEYRTFPLDKHRTVRFTVPEGFSLRDLARLSCHLATYCHDFDPTRPTQGTVVAMARVEGPQDEARR